MQMLEHMVNLPSNWKGTFVKNSAMSSSNWLYQASYDSAMDLSGDELTTQDEFIRIEVRNPRTHLNKTKALYTDYEIYVQTNSIAFSKSNSSVRRRYSDFQWLHKRLSAQFFLERSLPELPPKRLLGRFKRQFLKYRKRGLQRFLENIAKESAYLSDISVHLFLQTDLPVNEIERCLGGTESCGELVDVLQNDRRHFQNVKTCDKQHDDYCECEVNFDFDSGFSYSTTGSINDITSVQPSHESFQFFNSKKLNDNNIRSCLKADMTHEVVQKLGQTAHKFSLFPEDDGNIDYDADNEVDETPDTKTSPFLDINDDLFIFEKNLGQEYSLDRAVELIQKRTKPSERFFAPDLDSDDCFDISEYDIIESDSDSRFLNNFIERISQPYAESKVYSNNSVRSSLSEKDESQPKKNKFIIAKVRSLPKLRFPMKHVERNKLTSRKLTSDCSRLNKINRDSKNFDNALLKHFYNGISTPRTEPTLSNTGLLSSDDYLTTIHTVTSKDSHLDTLSGDVPPSQFYNCSKRRKKRAIGLTSNSLKNKGRQCGRFSVSAVKPYLSSLFESNEQTHWNYEKSNLLKKMNKFSSTDIFKCTLNPKNPNDSQLLQTYDIL
ncbi:uncharacterized protein LOC100199607 isoform X1 [Hydra vulgaris]|uniref:uncharacterized protein LOC100199607 isoform X1 n=2 Tax=Hydra vulgaris TaxID=6087 RepID=UPI001F5ED32C|nr:uncharacterized protein LOC100199607 isoform X1 [Hydra vulgaris]